MKNSKIKLENNKNFESKGHAVVVWVTTDDDNTPIQVVGGII